MSDKSFIVTTTRLENFSDGVFAIILTLSAFQFKVPAFTTEATISENFQQLIIISPYVIGFVFSFIYVAVFWVNHHQLYHTLKEVDSKLLWYNIHSLFWISVIPFTIAMVGDHPTVPITAIALGFVLLMASVATYLLLRYSYVKSKLADENLTFLSIRGVMRKNMAAILVSSIGIIAAFKFVYVSYLIYFVVLAIFMIPHTMEKRLKSTRRVPDNPAK